MESAKQEFPEKGFSGASLRSIATMAKAATGALYNYYKNKEELFAVVLKDAADAFFLHVICGDGLRDLQELVAYDVPRNQAEVYMEKLERFRHAGWREIIGH
ncbi:MAG: helix-turn-helix domain-containing protein [Eubacteriales bacterium]|nr:helix-turn-helix domain-containing protein [Eubacteriales bacterium]